MAYLKEDSTFTHVIAIDFGTGASGYGIAPKTNSKPSIEVFNPIDENDDQKTPTAIFSITIKNSLDLAQEPYKNTQKFVMMMILLIYFKHIKWQYIKIKLWLKV